MGNLLPELPEEICGAQIGSCYDPVSRRLYRNKNAIDPGKLDAKAVRMVSGKASLRLKANTSTSKNAADSFFSVDSKLKLGSWVSVGFNMASSHSNLNTQDMFTCYCSYIYTGQHLILNDHGADTLFNYMTDEFQKALEDLSHIQEPSSFLRKYFEFVQTFGYGCVTELHLTSGSAFRINVDYKNNAIANHAKYAGSLGVGTPWGGASVASEFAGNVLKAGSGAELSMEAEYLPERTPTKDWCDQIMTAVYNAGLSKLADTPEIIHPYTGSAPEAPEIPIGKPSEKKLPSFSSPVITEDLQKELMKQDNFNGSWESYLKAQKNAYEKLKPEIIVQEVCENRQRLLTMPVGLYTGNASSRPPKIEQAESPWDLGGYIPCGYKVTPWTKLFPQLKGMALPTTFTSIYIAKAYVYYLTRMQFASYLYFLADVGGSLCENSNIGFDAGNYDEACKKLLKNISDALSTDKGTFHLSDYEKMVAGFEQYIFKMPNFYSKTTYWHFFMNYPFFIENSYGFIVVVITDKKGGYMDIKTNLRPLPSPFSVIGMLKNGYRFYQVLTPDAKLKSVVYFQGVFTRAVRIIGGLRAKPRIDANGFKYYVAENSVQLDSFPAKGTFKETRLYGAGSPEIKSMAKSSIMGRPMIADFDLDTVIQFANPDQPL